jgi:phage baseplate assembly protein gpV
MSLFTGSVNNTGGYVLAFQNPTSVPCELCLKVTSGSANIADNASPGSAVYQLNNGESMKFDKFVGSLYVNAGSSTTLQFAAVNQD